MSQPFDQQCQVPSLRALDDDKGEFWVSNPWQFSSSGENLSAYERNGIFLNLGGGAFHDISHVSGANSDGDGRTVVAWDITGDGMPELLVRQAGGGALLVLENNFPKANWLNVSLRGKESNRFGIGAKLTCEVAGRVIRRELYPTVNFLGQKPSAVHFGLSDAEAIERLTITWPSGQEQVLEGIAINQHVVIVEGDDVPRPVTPGQSLHNLAQGEVTSAE